MKIKTKIVLLTTGTVVVVGLVLGSLGIFLFNQEINKLNKQLFAEKVLRMTLLAYEQDELVFEGVYDDVKEAQARVLDKIRTIYRDEKDETMFPFIVSSDGKIVLHPTRPGDEKFSDDLDLGQFLKSNEADADSTIGGVIEYTTNGEKRWGLTGYYEPWQWFFCYTTTVTEKNSAIYSFLLLTIIITLASLLLAGAITYYMSTRNIVKPIILISEGARRFAIGDLALEGMDHKKFEKINNRSDELGDIGKAFAMLIEYLTGKTKISQAIAQGDMTSDVNIASDEDLLGKAFTTMTDSLNKAFTQINEAASQVASGSGQVSDASQTLSLNSTEQASSLEQITSSMTELGSQTKSNAENATQANQLSAETRTMAENGNNQMNEMVATMADITESSKEIAKIIKAIDDIAFQTNLLALNAAVEAARAGKHGKGFAVVAQEVRNLAGRSAKAAQETADLIAGSVQNVENGTDIVNKTAEVLGQIVDGIVKVTDLVAEIAAASNEQAQGIEQVNQGLNQIEQVTQQNTANAEETASAAEQLSSMATQLRQLVSRFKLKGRDGNFGTENMLDVEYSPTHDRQPDALSNQGWGEDGKDPDKRNQVVKPEDMIALDDDFGKY